MGIVNLFNSSSKVMLLAEAERKADLDAYAKAFGIPQPKVSVEESLGIDVMELPAWLVDGYNSNSNN